MHEEAAPVVSALDDPGPRHHVLRLLADTDGAPTPAQVRAALKGTSPEDLVALTDAARVLTTALETIETTGRHPGPRPEGRGHRPGHRH